MPLNANILTRLVAVATLFVSACTTQDMTVGAEAEVEISRAATDTGYDDSDFQCLREAVYFEAGALSQEGQRAVANVILNRAADPRFPNSVCGVVREGESRGACQFSYRCDGRGEVFADKVKFRNATEATRVALENPEEDVSNGALYFHAKWMRPGWFATLQRTVTLGGNIFYRG